MNVRSFERLVSAHGAPAAGLDALTRHLRAMGLLPLGGRGTNAPDITPQGAAIILLVLAGVPNPNSREQVEGFLAHFGREKEQVPQPNAALDLLAGILADTAQAATIDEVRVCRNTAEVTFAYQDGRTETYRSLSEERLRLEGAERSGFRVEGVLSQALLVRASVSLRQSADVSVH